MRDEIRKNKGVEMKYKHSYREWRKWSDMSVKPM